MLRVDCEACAECGHEDPKEIHPGSPKDHNSQPQRVPCSAPLRPPSFPVHSGQPARDGHAQPSLGQLVTGSLVRSVKHVADGNCTDPWSHAQDGNCLGPLKQIRTGNVLCPAKRMADGNCADNQSHSEDGNCVYPGNHAESGNCADLWNHAKDGNCVYPGNHAEDGTCADLWSHSEDGNCVYPGNHAESGNCADPWSHTEDRNCVGPLKQVKARNLVDAVSLLGTGDLVDVGSFVGTTVNMDPESQIYAGNCMNTGSQTDLAGMKINAMESVSDDLVKTEPCIATQNQTDQENVAKTGTEIGTGKSVDAMAQTDSMSIMGHTRQSSQRSTGKTRDISSQKTAGSQLDDGSFLKKGNQGALGHVLIKGTPVTMKDIGSPTNTKNEVNNKNCVNTHPSQSEMWLGTPLIQSAFPPLPSVELLDQFDRFTAPAHRFVSPITRIISPRFISSPHRVTIPTHQAHNAPTTAPADRFSCTRSPGGNIRLLFSPPKCCPPQFCQPVAPSPAVCGGPGHHFVFPPDAAPPGCERDGMPTALCGHAVGDILLPHSSTPPSLAESPVWPFNGSFVRVFSPQPSTPQDLHALSESAVSPFDGCSCRSDHPNHSTAQQLAESQRSSLDGCFLGFPSPHPSTPQSLNKPAEPPFDGHFVRFQFPFHCTQQKRFDETFAPIPLEEQKVGHLDNLHLHQRPHQRPLRQGLQEQQFEQQRQLSSQQLSTKQQLEQSFLFESVQLSQLVSEEICTQGESGIPYQQCDQSQQSLPPCQQSHQQQGQSQQSVLGPFGYCQQKPGNTCQVGGITEEPQRPPQPLLNAPEWSASLSSWPPHDPSPRFFAENQLPQHLANDTSKQSSHPSHSEGHPKLSLQQSQGSQDQMHNPSMPTSWPVLQSEDHLKQLLRSSQQCPQLGYLWSAELSKHLRKFRRLHHTQEVPAELCDQFVEESQQPTPPGRHGDAIDGSTGDWHHDEMKAQRSPTADAAGEEDGEHTLKGMASSSSHYSKDIPRCSFLNVQKKTMMYSHFFHHHEKVHGFATYKEMVEHKNTCVRRWLENVSLYYPHPLGDFLP